MIGEINDDKSLFRRLELLGWAHNTQWMAATKEPYELFVAPSGYGSLAYFHDHRSWQLAMGDGKMYCPTRAQVVELLGRLEAMSGEG